MDILNRIPKAISAKDCKSGHLFDYFSEMKSRDDQGIVRCRCARCGRIFSADCGLSLMVYGDLAPLYQYGVMYA